MTNSRFTSIGIIGKPRDKKVIPTLNAIAEHLSSLHITVTADENTAALIDQKFAINGINRSDMRANCDLIIVVGGDGTLLDAARMLSGVDIPLIGVNLGRLGFLVDVSPDAVAETISAMLEGEFIEEKRFLLETELIRSGEVQVAHKAFNDVVLHSGDVLRMLEFETHADDKFISVHRADGMIVTGPTGSTAYALSGGGPILHPSLDAIMLVPICPHTLTDRPLVLNASTTIEVVLDQDNQVPAVCSCDGQLNFNVLSGDRLRIKRNEASVTLLHPQDYDYFRILRDKLGWGRDRFVPTAPTH